MEPGNRFFNHISIVETSFSEVTSNNKFFHLSIGEMGVVNIYRNIRFNSQKYSFLVIAYHQGLLYRKIVEYLFETCYIPKVYEDCNCFSLAYFGAFGFRSN